MFTNPNYQHIDEQVKRIIAERWSPGRDKFEAMKADEAWEKAHEGEDEE